MWTETSRCRSSTNLATILRGCTCYEKSLVVSAMLVATAQPTTSCDASRCVRVRISSVLGVCVCAADGCAGTGRAGSEAAAGDARAGDRADRYSGTAGTVPHKSAADARWGRPTPSMSSSSSSLPCSLPTPGSATRTCGSSRRQESRSSPARLRPSISALTSPLLWWRRVVSVVQPHLPAKRGR